MSSTAVVYECEMCEAGLIPLFTPCSSYYSFIVTFLTNNIYIWLLEFARQQIESSQMKQN